MYILLILLAFFGTLWWWRRRNPDRHRRAIGYALLTAIVLVWLNVINLCAPGWCESYGFPLKYRGWSDAQVTFNDVLLDDGAFDALSLIVNILIVLAATAVVYVVSRPAPENR